MTIAVGDKMVCFARVLHSTLSDIAANSWSMELGTLAGTDAEVLDDIREYIDAIFNAGAAAFSDEYSGGRVTVENRTQDKFENDVNLTWAGTASSDALPPTVAALLIGRTGAKRVQGRKYLVGCDQDSENNGVWLGVQITWLEAVADAWWQEVTMSSGTVIKPGIVRGISGSETFEPFTGRSVVSENRTMRTRTIGRGL